MSSFGNDFVLDKNIKVNNGVFIGAVDKTTVTTLQMVGANIIMDIDGSQSGEPGIAYLNMAALTDKCKVRMAGLPVVTGASNTPPNDLIVPVNGLYGYRSAGGNAPAQIFMKMTSIP